MYLSHLGAMIFDFYVSLIIKSTILNRISCIVLLRDIIFVLI